MKLPKDIMLKRCEVLLIAMLGEEMAPKWWDSRNKAFDMKTPKEVWKTEPEKVYEYLMYCASK